MENFNWETIDIDQNIDILLEDLNPDELVLTEYELEEIINLEEAEISSIPPLTFIDDKDSQFIANKSCVSVSIPTRSSPRKQASCSICGNVFKKPKVLAKHFMLCSKKQDLLLSKSE